MRIAISFGISGCVQRQLRLAQAAPPPALDFPLPTRQPGGIRVKSRSRVEKSASVAGGRSVQYLP
ncbi:MAG: hypothetical protein C0480_16320 [Bradyrhizobium sp.]|nr:hypothetical protein [Bradyrhizobium sp.]